MPKQTSCDCGCHTASNVVHPPGEPCTCTPGFAAAYFPDFSAIERSNERHRELQRENAELRAENQRYRLAAMLENV